MKNKNYIVFLSEVKEQIKSSQIKAALAVNSSLIELYWNLGKLIVEKQKKHSWGDGVVDELSRDLKFEFPGIKGFSGRNLLDMRRLYLFYTSEIVRQVVAKFEIRQETPEFPISQQLVAKIPWGHNLMILNKVKEPAAALFYIQQTIQHNWSRAMLEIQIEQNLYTRQGKAFNNFDSTLPEQQAQIAQQILKDPYNFNFLTMEPKVQERDLEKKLTDHIIKFLLELGKGFAFVGSQYPLSVGSTEYHIDLLFYHLHLRCYVVIELKTTAFQPEYAGKMNFYLSAVNDLVKSPEDQPSIGILLCKDKDNFVMEYALRDMNKPIGISGFTFTEALPDNLKSSIPTVEEFEQEMNKIPNATT